MSKLKALVRQSIQMPGVNPAVVAVAKRMPHFESRARIPVNRPFAMLKIDGIEILLSHPSRCQVAQEVFWNDGKLGKAQDMHALSAAIAFSRTARHFLDIGSYSGMFAIAAAKANPELRAYAFEIVGENFVLIWENVLRNNVAARVEPMFVAVGPSDGEMTAPYSIGSGTLASSISLSWEFEQGLSVPIRPLDKLFPSIDGPVAMKIDVEGFEMEIFDGAGDFLRAHRPDMVCEVLRRAKRVPEMMSLLRSLGYRWLHITENGFVERDEIVADKDRRDWLLTTRTVDALASLGLKIAR